VNVNLDWDRSVIDLAVPGEKTKSVWSSRTSQLVRKIGNRNQSIAFILDVIFRKESPHSFMSSFAEKSHIFPLKSPKFPPYSDIFSYCLMGAEIQSPSTPSSSGSVYHCVAEI